MKKSIQKITSLLLTLVLTLLTFAPATVNAVVPGEDSASAGMIGSSGSVLFRVSGAQATTNLRQSLNKYNIAVDNNTSIDVMTTSSESDTQVIVVTDVDGETMTKSVIISLDENGNVKKLPERGTASTAGYAGDDIDFMLDGSFVVVWALQSFICLNGPYYCYRPTYAEMIYYNYGNYTVTRAKMIPRCCGIELEYPGLEIVSLDKYEFWMDIVAYQSNRYYTNTPDEVYRSDRVICLSPGYFQLDFEFIINGRTYLDMVDIGPYNDNLFNS